MVPPTVTFKVPALKAGTYAIEVETAPPCAFDTTGPICEIASIPQQIGYLRAIGAASDSAWHITPTTTASHRGFELQAVSRRYDDCGYEFGRNTVTVDSAGKSISILTAVASHPERVCIAPSSPTGPKVKVPALPMGNYSVYVSVVPDCAIPDSPSGIVCKIALPKPEVAAEMLKVTDGKTDTEWHIKPTSLPANQEAEFQAVNALYGSCQSEFTAASVSVDQSQHTVSILTSVTEHPDHVCITNVSPWGPKVTLPKLSKGEYSVFVSVVPSCAIAKDPNSPICEIALPRPTLAAEKLTVTGEIPQHGWFTSPDHVQAGTPFQLSVLNYDYHPCMFSFNHANAEVTKEGIKVSFSVDSSGAQFCTTDYRAGGPTFSIVGLPAGKYPILVSVNPSCMYLPSPCAVTMIAPQTVDTLVIGASSGLTSQRLRLVPEIRGRIQGRGYDIMGRRPNAQGKLLPWIPVFESRSKP